MERSKHDHFWRVERTEQVPVSSGTATDEQALLICDYCPVVRRVWVEDGTRDRNGVMLVDERPEPDIVEDFVVRNGPLWLEEPNWWQDLTLIGWYIDPVEKLARPLTAVERERPPKTQPSFDEMIGLVPVGWTVMGEE